MYFDFTQYLQLVRGYSPVVAALYALPACLVQLATANAAGKLAARRGARLVLTAGLVASAAGLLILSASGVSTRPLLYEAGLALLGAGIGLAMPPSTGAIMPALPPAKAGFGSAINDLDRELGGAFGVGLLGSLTLARYKSAITGARPALAPAAREGLAPAIAVARTPAAIQTARTAFTSGLESPWPLAPPASSPPPSSSPGRCRATVQPSQPSPATQRLSSRKPQAAAVGTEQERSVGTCLPPVAPGPVRPLPSRAAGRHRVAEIDGRDRHPDNDKAERASRMVARRHRDRADRDAQDHGNNGQRQRGTRGATPLPRRPRHRRQSREPRGHPGVDFPADLFQERLDHRVAVTGAELTVGFGGGSDLFRGHGAHVS
jgi:Major Facilitator Superfamily